MKRFTGLGVFDVQHMQDIAMAEEQASKDAAAALAKGFKGYGERMRKEREKEQAERMEQARRLNSQHDLNTLATAIREFVWAEMRLAKAEIMGGKDSPEVKKQQEQSSRMETSLREQLEILNMRVMDGQNGGRPHHRMR